MAGGANPQNVAQYKQPWELSKFSPTGGAPSMQFNPSTQNLGGTLPSGNMSQTDFRATVLGGQPQQLPPGFSMPGVGATSGTQAGGVQSPASQPAASPVGGNVSETSANLFNQAAAGPNIGQFMNPYTSEVIGRTGMDMARQAQMQQNTLGAQATQAGAFGGSRHGVAEGTMMGDYGRAFGDIAAQQRQQGFNTALGAAQQQQGIQSGLAEQGFGFGERISNRQMSQGRDMRDMMQQLIDAARGQYGGYTGAPMASLSAPMAALGAANMGQNTSTQRQQPGLFNYMSLLLGGL